MYWFVIIPLVLFAIYNVLRVYGVFEFSAGTRQHKDIVTQRDKFNKKMKVERFKLRVFESSTNFFRGILFPMSIEESHKYYIERLNIRSEVLDRFITPEELRGKYVLIFLCGVLLSPLALLNTLWVVFPLGGLILLSQYHKIYDKKIQDEDAIIDVNFLNLFLLMYSKLKMGSRGRLTSVVESYIDTIETSIGDVEVKNTMLKLSEFLLNNLSMYPDHEAIPLLRERYRSATIVNFCNVATQALQGIDNADTLLTTRLDLISRNNILMEANAQKLVIKGQRSLYLIYVILFIFIGIGWYSKLPF